MRFADLVILAWIPFSLLLFGVLRPRHAVLASYLGAWLFLPMKAGLVIHLLPDIDKITSASVAVLLGVMLFDAARLFTLRFRWFDIPMLLWCTTPFMSSITNGLGAWDGASAIIEQVTIFGIPYYIGRVYFNDWEGVRELALAIFIGGVIYVPLCLWEIRMSPQLHHLVYGYHQHSFGQTIRFGGFRPMVFMQHGLAVGFWMTAASLIGVWMLVTGSLRNLWGIPMIFIVPVLLATTVLCKSAAGLGFLMVGVAALFAIKWTKSAVPVYLLIAFAPLYMFVRASGIVDGTAFVEWATAVFGEERAQSLDTRMHAENVLTAHALERPLFGYGRWSTDSRTPGWMVIDEETGRNAAIPDGMWVIAMGRNGVTGVVALTASVLLPALLLRRRVPPQWWAHPMAAPGAALAILLTLHMADNLLNAMVNPLFICAMGGLVALGAQVVTQQVRQPRGFAIQPSPHPVSRRFAPMQQQPQHGVRAPAPIGK